ncbi:hypothetical protein B0O99DRAFT_680936 [Bisporella sp. PMI_857]|nr:hypothetical protein B0O99DRAFT_680936 [Bisporella sp. PMI_857]
MPSSLTYKYHLIAPKDTCSICLEPVAYNVVNISCHEQVDCAECMNHWLRHQIKYCKVPGRCPRCHTIVSTSNLEEPKPSIKYEEVKELVFNNAGSFEEGCKAVDAYGLEDDSDTVVFEFLDGESDEDSMERFDNEEGDDGGQSTYGEEDEGGKGNK